MSLPSTEPGLPNFSRIAAVIADPSRARMLAALLCGEYRSAGELATVAGITPQAASTQLAQLVDTGLVAVRQQGRHKYFALADGDVAHALEALSLGAGPAPNPHTQGEKGVMGASRPSSLPGLQLSNAGSMWVARLGVTLPNKTASRFAYPCMDWSERKDHLAGTLARALLDHYLAKHWLRAASGSRALTLTPLGQRELMPLLEAVLL